MPKEAQYTAPASAAERKKKLIAQGAAFRAQIIHSRNGAQEGLRPDALAREAVSYLTATAFAALKNGGVARIAAGIDLQTILPLVAAGVSALSKRSLLKPAITGIVALGAAAAVAALVFKRKKARNHGGGGEDGTDTSR
jgi:hypothetical protein